MSIKLLNVTQIYLNKNVNKNTQTPYKAKKHVSHFTNFFWSELDKP